MELRVWGKPDVSGISSKLLCSKKYKELVRLGEDELGLGTEMGPEPHQEAESTGMNSGECD